MSGAQMMLLGMGAAGTTIRVGVGYGNYADKYTNTDVYGYDPSGYIVSSPIPSGGQLLDTTYKGRTIVAIQNQWELYSGSTSLSIAYDGLMPFSDAPTKMLLGGSLYTLPAPAQSWRTGASVTFSGASNYYCNWTGHGLSLNQPVKFEAVSGGTLPAGIVSGQTYYVWQVVSANAFRITTTPGGSMLTFTGSGSGTRYGYKDPSVLQQISGVPAGNVFNVPIPQTVTITIASPAVLTASTSGPSNGTAVRLATDGFLPTGLVANTTYYVVNQSGTTFNLAASPGGTPINTSGTQSGSHTATCISTVTLS